MCQFVYDFSAGIPLNLSIIYGKDPNFKTEKRLKRVNSLISMLSAFASSIQIKESTLSHRFSIT